MLCDYALLYLFVLLWKPTYSLTGEDKCLQQSPCVCRYSDGTGIDLSGVHAPTKFLQLDLEHQDFNASSTLYFHVCGDAVLPEVNSTDCSQVSLCLKKDGKYKNVGVAADAKFSSELQTVKLTFQRDQELLTTIKLICTPYDEESYFKELKSEPNVLNLLLFSQYACIQELKIVEGLSTGSLLIILLLVFSTVYLVGGAALLHFLRGARGSEMIPNIDFWKDLPFLVRDGALFIQNGCSIPPRATMYDQI